MDRDPARWAVWFVDLLLVALIVGGGVMIAKQQTTYRDQELRAQMLETAIALSNAVTAELAQREVMGRALAAVVLREPDLSEEDYRFFVSRLGNSDPDIRNVAISPGLVVKYVYPIEGNTSVLGVDLSTMDRMMPAINRAIETRKPTITNVIELVQGGPGMILRIPIFLNDRQNEAGDFWGLVSIVMRHELFFDEVLRPQDLAGMSAAVRSIDDDGATSVTIRGDDAVFSQEPVLIDIDVPSGQWELGLVPAEGWPRWEPFLGSFSWLILLLCLLGVSSIHLIWHLRSRGQIARRRLLDAIESLDDGFVLFDAEDRLQLSNSTYLRMYGRDNLGDIQSQTFSEIAKETVKLGRIMIPPAEEASWIDSRIASHRAAMGSLEQEMSDGRWMRISERRTSDGGTVSVHADITDLRKARDQAEQANRAITEFLNNINHEMRTPLTVIMGFNTFLAKPELLPSFSNLSAALQEPMVEPSTLREAFRQFDTEMRAYAGRIQRSGQHLLDLVNDTLDLAQIQNHTLQLKREQVNLCDLMRDCEQQFEGLAREKNLELTVTCDPVRLEIDPVRLRQAMSNIIGNAIKFTDRGFVRVTHCVIGKSVRISVEDSGSGIAEAHQDRIFERFWQGDSSVTRQHNGTGLGLAITLQLVKMHGGRIELESKLGVGSTFSIFLPMDSAMNTDQGPQSEMREAS